MGLSRAEEAAIRRVEEHGRRLEIENRRLRFLIIAILAVLSGCKADQLIDPDPYCEPDSTGLLVIDSTCIDVIGFLP